MTLAVGWVRGAETTLASPGGKVSVQVSDSGGKLTYAIMLGDTKVVETSDAKFLIDGKDLCDGAAIERTEVASGEENFPVRGVHARADVKWKGTVLHLKQAATGTACTVEGRAFDDGVAFRFVSEGAAGQVRTPDELTEFHLAAGSTVWSHNLSGHYEGTYEVQPVDAFPAGTWAAPPMTFRLPNGGGYASIMEAGLVNYSGMALECSGPRTFRVGLGHRQPVSHPYELRYPKEDVERLSKPATVEGTITTPWRAIMVAKDLNTLVNSDLVEALSPAPDSKLFPQGFETPWVKTGRAVWRYLDNVDAPQDPSLEPAKKAAVAPSTAPAARKAVSLAEAKNWNRMAAELGFEFNILEGFWRNYSDADLRELVEDANKQHVQIFVWLHSKDLHDEVKRHAVLDRLEGLGIAGMKIDFFDHEHKETIDLYHAILREAAERHLLVDFHGANKPTGEERTWPNEVVREAIRGMEARTLKARAFHETTLPFSRFLAGPAEYTGMIFTARRGDTSMAHQIGVPIVFTAPLLTYGAHPTNILKSPAVELIKSIPSTWDETIALPGSEIGEMAAFARRKGSTWFVAAINGPAARQVEVPLTFLKGGQYKMMTVSDAGMDDVKVENSDLKGREPMRLSLQAGGGFVARFTEDAGAK